MVKRLKASYRRPRDPPSLNAGEPPAVEKMPVPPAAADTPRELTPPPPSGSPPLSPSAAAGVGDFTLAEKDPVPEVVDTPLPEEVSRIVPEPDQAPEPSFAMKPSFEPVKKPTEVIKFNKSNVLPPREVSKGRNRGGLPLWVLYGGVAIAAVLLLYGLMANRGGKKGGPTIVEVTEITGDGEKRSEKVTANANRMSSPRIVFGDLRRNPSIKVAPK